MIKKIFVFYMIQLLFCYGQINGQHFETKKGAWGTVTYRPIFFFDARESVHQITEDMDEHQMKFTHKKFCLEHDNAEDAFYDHREQVLQQVFNVIEQKLQEFAKNKPLVSVDIRKIGSFPPEYKVNMQCSDLQYEALVDTEVGNKFMRSKVVNSKEEITEFVKEFFSSYRNFVSKSKCGDDRLDDEKTMPAVVTLQSQQDDSSDRKRPRSSMENKNEKKPLDGISIACITIYTVFMGLAGLKFVSDNTKSK